MANATLRRIAIWTSSTLVAAILGGVVTLVYSSARPTIKIVDVRPSLSANERFVTDKTEIVAPPDFLELLEETSWTSLQELRPGSIKYESFIEGLNDNEERMKRHRRSIQSFLDDRPRLQAILDMNETSDDDKNEFYDLWERNDGFIYGSIRGEFHRGNILLPQKTYEGEPFFQLSQEETLIGELGGLLGSQIESPTVWVVLKKGGRFASSLSPHPRKPKDLDFQKQVAYALAYFDTEILKKILNTAEADAKDIDIAGNILEEIEKIRTRFSRWGVTVSISNAGSQSLAILPFAQLIVETQGLVHEETTVDRDMAIPLELRDDSGEPATIQVQGGSATLVTFVSTDFIAEDEGSNILLRTYDLGARDCRVRLFTAGGSFLTRSTIVTKKKNFAPTLSRLNFQSL